MPTPMRACAASRQIAAPARVRAWRPALWLVGLLWVSALAAQPVPNVLFERGKALFEKNCAVCHGSDGQADTPVGRLLTPHPRNFADQIEMARLSVDRIYAAIKDGKPGTAMASWKQVLSETEIGDLIDYLRGFAATRKTAALSADKLSLEVGRRIYQRECASCHGLDGRANTEVAKVLQPPPRNFADPIGMARLDDGRIYLAIYRGRPGTAMGGRGELLAPLEIIDVMRYLRSLAQPLPMGMTPAQLDARVGEQIYTQYCINCHGARGDGKTELGKHLDPPPRDFTQADAMAAASDAELARSVVRGLPGTGMAPWEGVLNKDDIRRVVGYIRQSFPRR